MAAPLIGVTTERSFTAYGSPRQGIGEAYLRALAQAGAIPVMLPPGLAGKALDELIDRLDGLLLPGGGDVHPCFYHGEEHPLISGIEVERDEVEIALVQAAAGRGLPFLGVCRGLQVVNVVLGGSLYADLETQRHGSLPHSRFPEQARDYLAHPVRLATGSRTARILGGKDTLVNSMHHQGICELAPGLQPTAWAPDGLVEAVEMPDHPFALAVQWHPECLLEHASARELFRAFVSACQGNHPA